MGKITRIIEIAPDHQAQALRLHYEAFSNSPCIPCKGGCCKGCASTNGYLPDSTAELYKKRWGWDAKTGFQGDRGCLIPVPYRSTICVGYMCGGQYIEKNGIRQKFTRDQRIAVIRMKLLLATDDWEISYLNGWLERLLKEKEDALDKV